MTITPDLECNVVDALRSDPIEGPSRAILLLLIYDLGDRDGQVFEGPEELSRLVTERWDELLSRVLEMAHRLEASAA
jgi:hypothetical protein